MLFSWFPLSILNLKKLLHEPGYEISHDTVGFSGAGLVFGPPERWRLGAVGQ